MQTPTRHSQIFLVMVTFLMHYVHLCSTHMNIFTYIVCTYTFLLAKL